MTENEIAMRTLRLIEEIAVDRSGHDETEDERAWSHVECRKNHLDWGRPVATTVAAKEKEQVADDGFDFVDFLRPHGGAQRNGFGKYTVRRK